MHRLAVWMFSLALLLTPAVGCDDGESPSAPDTVTSADAAGSADTDTATAAVDFTVSVSASPESGPVPLSCTLVATVAGDVGIADVALQWYRGGVKLEGKTEAAWIIILVETTTMWVEATYTAPDGTTYTRDASVMVTVQ